MAWLFWIIAGGLAAAAATAVTARAMAAARAAQGAEDPALGVYRRQLTELDELAARNLLGAEEHRAAFAEAGRRLLAEGERASAAATPIRPPPRRLILAGVAFTVLVALGLYLALGSPGVPDQPYRTRLAHWRTGDPTQLKPAEMAAVLRVLAAQRPTDPQAFEFLGRASLSAGDAVAAVEALRTAVRLKPKDADLRAMLGEALSAATDGGAAPPEALEAFRQALAIDPANLAARFFLAKARVDAGDRAGGLADWRAMEAQFPVGDPRRVMLEQEIAKASGVPKGGEAIAAASAPEQAAFIRAMVQRLAVRLQAAPDDPDGWARLIRAYGVLGDKAAQAKAVERARALFGKRPADLAKVEAEAPKH